MSHEATAWAFKQTGMTVGERLTLYHLADCHNPKFGCFPSQSTIALETGQSKRSVQRQMKTLEESGMIIRVERYRDNGSRRSDVYFFSFESQFVNAGGGDTVSPYPDPNDRGVVTPVAPLEPVIEPVTTNVVKNKQKETVISILTSVLDDEIAQAVIDHRKAKRSPLQTHTAKLLVKQFSKLSNPNDGANEMLIRGWTGFNAKWFDKFNSQFGVQNGQGNSGIPTSARLARQQAEDDDHIKFKRELAESVGLTN